MRCKDCSQVRGYPYKRSHLVALRPTKISASDPPSLDGRKMVQEAGAGSWCRKLRRRVIKVLLGQLLKAQRQVRFVARSDEPTVPMEL
jgi:hypothetical protein